MISANGAISLSNNHWLKSRSMIKESVPSCTIFIYPYIVYILFQTSMNVTWYLARTELSVTTLNHLGLTAANVCLVLLVSTVKLVSGATDLENVVKANILITLQLSPNIHKNTLVRARKCGIGSWVSFVSSDVYPIPKSCHCHELSTTVKYTLKNAHSLRFVICCWDYIATDLLIAMSTRITSLELGWS